MKSMTLKFVYKHLMPSKIGKKYFPNDSEELK